MLAASTRAMLAPLRRAVQPTACASLSTTAAASSSSSASAGVRSASRRSRRLRRVVQKAPREDATVSSRLSEMREALKLVSNIKELSQNGLTQRVEMPQEMLSRLTTIVKKRTHSQLLQLRESLVADATGAERQVPLDMHKRAIGWTMERDEQFPPLLYGPGETMAYLAQDVEATYACAHQVFAQLQTRRPDFAPASVLDFGAGPGTASWVAREFFGDSLERFRVLEPSQSMVDAAEHMLDGFPGLSVRRSLSEMKREIQNGLQFDLVVVNFVLSEITNDLERVTIMSALWELLADRGVLVVVDRGSTWGSHQVRSARQFILDAVSEDDDERVQIVAPCPHHLECAATGNTWCHFAQRSPRVQFPRDATNKRWHGHKVSKFSYVVMEKNGRVPKREKPEQLARLIRGPLLANRHVHLDLCLPNGELERRSVTRGKAIREVYRAARKAHWGASWPANPDVYAEEK